MIAGTKLLTEENSHQTPNTITDSGLKLLSHLLLLSTFNLFAVTSPVLALTCGSAPSFPSKSSFPNGQSVLSFNISSTAFNSSYSHIVGLIEILPGSPNQENRSDGTAMSRFTILWAESRTLPRQQSLSPARHPTDP